LPPAGLTARAAGHSDATRPGAGAAAIETPFFFAVQDVPIYAVLHDAAADRAGAPVVLHVHGLGVEQITLYRQEVLAARAAAALGFPVLRYHARGHGDSAGASEDVTRETLVADARAAADEAKRRTGRTRVVWLGVRMGALVAALAGGPRSGRDDAAGFILWEPVSRPAEFFRQQLRTLLFSQVAGGHKPDATVDELLARLEAEGELDVFGYTLQRSLVQSFADASLAAALDGVRVPVLLAQVQARARLAPQHVQLAEALQGRATVTTTAIHSEPGYQLMSNPAWQSDVLTRVTSEWLDALA
jgi:pimeloyl-ACP methyl ester carboxylesterase